MGVGRFNFLLSNRSTAYHYIVQQAASGVLGEERFGFMETLGHKYQYYHSLLIMLEVGLRITQGKKKGEKKKTVGMDSEFQVIAVIWE